MNGACCSSRGATQHCPRPHILHHGRRRPRLDPSKPRPRRGRSQPRPAALYVPRCIEFVKRRRYTGRMVGGGWVAVVLAAAACSGGAASRPVALASTPDAPRAPAAAPGPPQKPAPRPECTKTLIAAATLAEVTAIIEAERCNGHVWNGSETPLMRAAVSGATDVVAYLVEAGAPVDFAIPEGKKLPSRRRWISTTGVPSTRRRRCRPLGGAPSSTPRCQSSLPRSRRRRLRRGSRLSS